jgi:hypothetical protein
MTPDDATRRLPRPALCQVGTTQARLVAKAEQVVAVDQPVFRRRPDTEWRDEPVRAAMFAHHPMNRGGSQAPVREHAPNQVVGKRREERAAHRVGIEEAAAPSCLATLAIHHRAAIARGDRLLGDRPSADASGPRRIKERQPAGHPPAVRRRPLNPAACDIGVRACAHERCRVRFLPHGWWSTSAAPGDLLSGWTIISATRRWRNEPDSGPAASRESRSGLDQRSVPSRAGDIRGSRQGESNPLAAAVQAFAEADEVSLGSMLERSRADPGSLWRAVRGESIDGILSTLSGNRVRRGQHPARLSSLSHINFGGFF